MNTPCLVLDLDRLDRNIDRMAAFATANGLALRPHAKTHKCREIAARQVAAGAVGICCATLHEAEQLAGAVPSILITSPIVAPAMLARAVALIAGGIDLAMVVDHAAVVAALAAIVPHGARLGVFVDVDPGFHRTGVADPAQAVAVAQAIAARPNLDYRGIQFYCGGEQHIAGFAERRAAIAARNLRLSETIAALAGAGLAPAIVTGGGTGTHRIDAEAGLLTEIQPGSYIFMDAEYLDCDLDGSGAPPFEPALSVHAAVISANHPGFVTIDAGVKALATDGGRPIVLAGAPIDSEYRFMGDEFGMLLSPPDTEPPSIGDRIVLVTPHCDPTVNLHSRYILERDGVAAGTWVAQGRGHG
jgi:3-hydroxy-D-aspartate aldolase